MDDTKSNIKIEFVGHSFFFTSASAIQDSMIILRFKTGSNNFNPFKGNGTAYRIGETKSPVIIRIVQDVERYSFYALYGSYADGSLITVTTANKFTFIGTYSIFEPTGIYAEIPIKTIFNQDNPPAITDIPHLSPTLSNFVTQRDINRTVAYAQTYSIFGGDATLGDWSYIR